MARLYNFATHLNNTMIEQRQFSITPGWRFQTGASLLVTLVMLLIALLAGLSMANLAMMNEKTDRNERDRVVALQAAEAALADAELDIENSSSAASRSSLFSPHSAIGFEINCARGDSNVFQGLCLNTGDARRASWKTLDITSAGANSPSVRFGRFTGQSMPFGAGPFPARLPRYLIELMPDNVPGQSTRATYLYRVTAIGFGTDPHSQAVVQSFYRKSSNQLHLTTGSH